MSDAPISFNINGAPASVSLDPDTPLIHVLRHDLGCKGARLGCGEGQCGACTVLVDGRPVQSCDAPLWSVAGRNVTTIEGLGAGALQRLFLEEQAAQCGFCTNGIILSLAALLQRDPPASRAEIIAHLDERHLCRCGAQPRILRVVDRALTERVA